MVETTARGGDCCSHEYFTLINFLENLGCDPINPSPTFKANEWVKKIKLGAVTY